MRDRTIDNGDEQTNSICLNPSCVSPYCCKDIMHLSSASSVINPIENSMPKGNGSPLNLSRCVSPSIVPVLNGRVSPPEKRVILEPNLNEEIKNIIKQSLESLVLEEKISSAEMNVLMTSLIEQKSFMNSEFMQSMIADYIRQNSNQNVS